MLPKPVHNGVIKSKDSAQYSWHMSYHLHSTKNGQNVSLRTYEVSASSESEMKMLVIRHLLRVAKTYFPRYYLGPVVIFPLTEGLHEVRSEELIRIKFRFLEELLLMKDCPETCFVKWCGPQQAAKLSEV